MCWFSETWGGAQVFFIVSCFYGVIQSSGHFIDCPPPKIDSTSILARQGCQCRGLCHFIDCPPPKIDSTSILARQGCQCRGLCHFDNWLQGVAFCQNLRHYDLSSNHHTVKTFLIAILCLTVGTAYGQYFIDAIQAGTDLVETARQS